MLKYASGATGVIQASTAFWPGHTERIEIHGTKGTAIITGDKLTAWQVENDSGEPAPVSYDYASPPPPIPWQPRSLLSNASSSTLAKPSATDANRCLRAPMDIGHCKW